MHNNNISKLDSRCHLETTSAPYSALFADAEELVEPTSAPLPLLISSAAVHSLSSGTSASKSNLWSITVQSDAHVTISSVAALHSYHMKPKRSNNYLLVRVSSFVYPYRGWVAGDGGVPIITGISEQHEYSTAVQRTRDNLVGDSTPFLPHRNQKKSWSKSCYHIRCFMHGSVITSCTNSYFYFLIDCDISCCESNKSNNKKLLLVPHAATK